MSRARARSPAWAPLALALAAACSGGGAEEGEPTRSNPDFFVLVAGEGQPLAAPEGFEGVVIDVVPGVEYHLEVKSSTPGTSRRLATINRHPFVLADGYVLIGSSRFGPVANGDRVSITAEGVALNGELVGQLPPKPDGSQE